MATLTLPINNLQMAGHYRESWEVVVPSETTIADLERAEFWVHVAKRLRRQSKIDVLWEDESRYAELIVLSSGTGFAKVKTLRTVEFDAADENNAPLDGFSVKWGGPHDKFRVVRNSDNLVMRKDFVKKSDAEAWARGHQAVVAA